MKNKDYWQQRAEAKVLDCEKMILDYEKRLKGAFLSAVKDIDKEVTSLYVKYAKDNRLSYAATLKYLTDGERREFQRDLEYYITRASDAAYRRTHAKELQSLSVRARVRRWEQMQANILMASESLFNALQGGTATVLSKVYNESYYRTAFDTYQFFKTGTAFNKPSAHTLKALLEYPWDGKSYSSKLWDMERGFADGLSRVMTTGLIRGQSVQEMSKALRDEAIGRDFGKGKAGGQLYKAQRLVRTEASYILNQATMDMYDELGVVEEYAFLGTLDSKTCDYCGGLDGKHYPLKEQKPGANCPPLHPHCRCTTIPYFDDEDLGERIARGANGKSYYVPGDMTYKEWLGGLNKGGKNGILKNIELPPEIDKIKGISEELKQEISNSVDRLKNEYDIHLDELYVESLGKRFNKVPFQYQPIDDKGRFKYKLVINRDYDFNGSLEAFNERIMRSHNSGVLAAQNVGDLIAHEMAHVMTFQDLNDYTMFIHEERALHERFVYGISGYANGTADGTECIAEGFVKLRHNEKLPADAEDLIKKYIERWKK